MKKYIVEVSDCYTKWKNEKNELHREDGPAIEYANGDRYYYINDKLHREDGPAVDYSNGYYKAYYINGNRHNENGPAVERATGYKEYWINGKRHREDGPAVESATGYKEYWINYNQLTKEQFENRTKTKELTVADIEKLIGHKVKIIKG